MPPDLKDVLLLAIMNPATLVAGFMIGRRADQMQKLVVGAFVAGIAGVLFAGLLMMIGLFQPKVRLLSGVFVVSAVLGIGWGWLGYATRPDPGGKAD